MNREEMYERTMQFSVRVVRMVKAMPRDIAEDACPQPACRRSSMKHANLLPYSQPEPDPLSKTSGERSERNSIQFKIKNPKFYISS